MLIKAGVFELLIILENNFAILPLQFDYCNDSMIFNFYKLINAI